MKTLPPYCIRKPMTDDPLPEFVVRLDSTLPKTHRVPVHPETREVWKERAQRLCWLETVLLYESEQDPAWQVERDALLAETEFRAEPLFMEQHLLLGSSFAGAVVPRTFSCHPETWEDTWAAMAEEKRARWQVVKEQEWRIEL